MNIDDSNITEDTVTENIATESTSEKEYKPFIYIGPTLNGKLKSNTVLQGNIEEITNYLSDVIKEYPQIKSLIVPISKLPEQKQKVRTPGNILYKYYSDIVSTMKIDSKEE